MLRAQGRLRGDYLAWTYEMRDPRVELLFRIATTAFHRRNFKPDGLANLNMGIRFDNEVLRRFYPAAWDAAWHERLTELSRRHRRSTRWSACARRSPSSREVALDDRRRITAFTLELARAVAQRGPRVPGGKCGVLRREMEERVRAAGGRSHARARQGHARLGGRDRPPRQLDGPRARPPSFCPPPLGSRRVAALERP